jgi:hypothetical protein
MNVNNINPYQGMQNAIRPDVGSGSSVNDNEVSSVSLGSNPTVLIDPPLFPIARYQNPNLMKKSTPTEAEINDQKLQNMVLAQKLKVSENDAVRSVTSEKSQTGTILSVKI